MKMNIIALATAVIGATLVCPSGVIRADDTNPLQDASFEERLPPGQGGWQMFENSLISNDQAHSGEQSMLNGGFSRTVAHQPFFTGSVSGSFQELPAESGSRWRLTGYGLTASKLKGVPAFGILQVSFFDADGNDIGTVETAGNEHGAKTSIEVNNQSPVDEWIFLDTGIATAPEGTEAVQAFTLYVDYSNSNVPQGVFFDDLSLCTLHADDDATSCGAN